MRGLRTDRPPTREQLLVLADRAERGPLTAAEAARLRAGIAAAYSRSAAGFRANESRIRYLHQLAPVRRLIQTAKRRGVRSIPVRDLETAIGAAVRPSGATGAREGRRVAQSA